MISNNPITVDGQVYDKLSINLAVTSFYKPSGDRDLNIALRVIPTRIDPANGPITLDSQASVLYRGSLSELQEADEQICVNKMISALQDFITGRGL